jgi:V8-like Glu-specific endopeptidase
MPWTSEQCRSLRLKFAALFPNERDVRVLLDDVGVQAAYIDLSGSSVTRWHEILQEVKNQDAEDKLLELARHRFPNDDVLAAIQKGLVIDTSNETPFDWNSGTELTREAITKGENTLVSISFLEQGLECAKSVGRIVVKILGRHGYGTGFLIKNNLLLTNNHVLESIEQARNAKVEFNYQESIHQGVVLPVSFTLDPDRHFFTSKENDWTVVAVTGDPNKVFGDLEIADYPIVRSEYVQIIQHPQGGLKQLAYRANVVTHVDTTRVQYLTDTLPGSSGSPVFNRQWQLVALHHASTTALPSEKTASTFVRNQGIRISVVVNELRTQGLL